MADRDVSIDITATDKTGPGTQSASRNLKKVEKSWRDVDGQGKRTVAAAQLIAGQLGAGLSRMAGSAKRWGDSGDTAGKRFVRGIGKGIAQLAELGGSIGGGLSKAVSAAGPYVQVAMAALLVGAVVTAAPAIAGAIVGGAGLGGVVGGLLIASKDARVASAFDGLKEEIGSGLQDAAKRFVPASLDAVKRAKAAFRGMLPDLRRIFDVSATWLGPLTTSLGKAAQSVLSGITQAVSKAGPIINVIGQGVEMMGRAVGQVFTNLSDNGQSMALALKAVFLLITGAIQSAGAALNILVEAFEFFVTKIPGGKKLLDSMTGSQDGAKTSAFNLAGGFQALAGDANGAAAGISNAKAKADEFADSNLSLREAQIAASDAVKDATKTITENGKAKGFNSQKGKENESALNSLARAFNTETEAGDRSGRSAREASDAYHNNRLKLIAMAEKAGYSKTQAELLAAQLLKTPKNVNTDVNVNTSTASAKLETFQKKVTNLKGKTVYVTVQVTSKGDHHIAGVGTQLKGAASGGPVLGRGLKGVDSVPMMLAPGEHVLTAREVDAAGGHAAIMSWRRRILAGDAASASAAGPVRSLAPSTGGVTVEKLEVRAYSDRFSLSQVMGDLAMHGAH